MSNPEKTVIEVNGVKLEIDLRTAKRVDTLRCGDRVKVLMKSGSEFIVKAGTVVGFEPFLSLPTVIVAYLDGGSYYAAGGVKFVYFNTSSKDIEIIKAIDDDQLDVDKATIVQQFEKQIAGKQQEIETLEMHRDYFLKNFAAYWAPVEKPTVTA